MKPIFKAVGVAFLLLSPAMAASMAASLHWTFENTAFSGGGQISGSFTIDTSNGALSSINVVTSGDGNFGGATYNYLNPTLTTGFFTLDLVASNAPNLLGAAAIVINFSHTLGTAGVDPILSASEGICSSSSCDGFSNARSLASGDVTTQAASTPEPSTAWLLIPGLCAAVIVIRGRKIRGTLCGTLVRPVPPGNFSIAG